MENSPLNTPALVLSHYVIIEPIGILICPQLRRIRIVGVQVVELNESRRHFWWTEESLSQIVPRAMGCHYNGFFENAWHLVGHIICVLFLDEPHEMPHFSVKKG